MPTPSFPTRNDLPQPDRAQLIELLNQRLGDADTTDLFTELSRSLDKDLWFLEAHLLTPA